MKNIFLTILLGFGFTIHAMDPAPADTITLVASDGKEFTVPVSFAQEAETVKLLMGGVSQESASKKVEFKNIGWNLLRYVEAIANAVEKHKKLKNKALLDAIEKEVGSFPSISLLKVSEFLGYKLGLDLAARAIAAHDVKLKYFMKQKLEQFNPLVARFYYLLRKKNLPDVDKNSYGFSIQDYLDYMPELIPDFIEKTIMGVWARLVHLRINNLNGLKQFMNKHHIDYLDLRFNQISEIPANIWQGLNQLQLLNLDSNKISAIPENAWKGLSGLRKLVLTRNQINIIAANAWKGLDKLIELFIHENKLNPENKKAIIEALPNATVYP